ncbi:TPA: DNA topoisomerase III [Mannheimia haemolytica]|uniref:DNA topoisomerase III n=1 Tax=Mannheimia haemolytica TaxID=75985 RepID=UPI0002B779FB|nr:DNA topoisomerase III [Mannheimia haemolytica]AGI32936.1 DNA topoisomerase III [Mannheimia haemolytica USDA-ARS-USMARC-183]AGI35092.1 DNA topoisomerase III [Mannheimia haemolytica USDA-ARS-USMARC-185]AGQ26909.1 DNA topoisomerase III [Mannheimia haemolytica D153]AGQ42476.1 DNA topoisomerase III [Mannheimia haemolytica D174]AGR75322.1 DNA topoisomerase III [Mannheimia haemolytica USMARC_2286]
MKLFICEKPSQARDLASVLGATSKGDGLLATNDKSIIVTWGFGHLVEQYQPEDYDEVWKRWAFETLPIIPAQWKMAPKKESKKQYNVVIGLIKKASLVVIATDADREGEMIARELLDLAGYRGQIQRCWLSALDDASIRKALQTLKSGKETEALYYAGMGRSRSDWLIGMNFSRLFTLMAQAKGYSGKPLSVGRVQSPTLALVVNRDREIANFVPKAHYSLAVQLATASDETFVAGLSIPEQYLDESGLCLDSRVIQQAEAQIKQVGIAKVITVETKREKKAPPLLYALSDLQGECNRLFGFGAQQVLDIAQSLYEEHKITTYPRTDCGYLPESQLTEVPMVIRSLVAADSELQTLLPRLNLQQKSRAWDDKKITAHHGIIPTIKKADLSKLSEEEMKVYDLIRRRYLAQFLPHLETDKTIATLQSSGHTLIARGNVIVSQGWRILFGKNADEDVGSDDEKQGLPALTANQQCRVTHSEVRTLQTKPPAHYTEGTLLEAMKNAARFVTDPRLKQRLRETEGLGTEATRAGLIQGLIDKGFLIKKKKSLMASAEAIALIDSLPDLLKNPGLTALWEQALNQIAEGSMTLDDFMQRQETFVRQLIGNCMQQGMSLGNIEIRKCPECGKPMRKINHAKGTFWGCTGYPDCQHKEADKKVKSTSNKSTKKNSSLNVLDQLNKLRSQL